MIMLKSHVPSQVIPLWVLNLPPAVIPLTHLPNCREDIHFFPSSWLIRSGVNLQIIRLSKWVLKSCRDIL